MHVLEVVEVQDIEEEASMYTLQQLFFGRFYPETGRRPGIGAGKIGRGATAGQTSRHNQALWTSVSIVQATILSSWMIHVSVLLVPVSNRRNMRTESRR